MNIVATFVAQTTLFRMPVWRMSESEDDDSEKDDEMDNDSESSEDSLSDFQYEASALGSQNRLPNCHIYHNLKIYKVCRPPLGVFQCFPHPGRN